jgi:hypothetical protein
MERDYSILRQDAKRRTLMVRIPGPAAGEVYFSVAPTGDSSTVTAQARSGGIAATFTGMSLVRQLTRFPEALAAKMADGLDWAADEQGRVGFIVIASEGSLARHAQADTAVEARPATLPPEFRMAWERSVNEAGFDASCARVFLIQAGFVVRFNKCDAPSADLDRLSVYRSDGRWLSSTVGAAVAKQIHLMCPASRVPHVSDERCPSAFR